MDTKMNRCSGFYKVDKILNVTAKAYNLQDALKKHQALKYWGKVAGTFVEEAKELTQAIDFKKGVLTVACLSREVAYKLKLLVDRIIQALNELIGRQVVYAIYLET